MQRRLHPDGHIHGFRVRLQLVNGGFYLTQAGWVGLLVDRVFDLAIHLMSSRPKAGLVMEGSDGGTGGALETLLLEVRLKTKPDIG